MLSRIFMITVLAMTACAPNLDHKKAGQVTDHSTWDRLLKAHVGPSGTVDYRGFIRDSTQLQIYLQELALHYPATTWTEEERLAYWINAYNAFTVKLIINHYPLQSIKDIRRGIPFINSVWDIRFIRIGDKKFSLNDIEHRVLRKEYNEPRIHFAINCASKSCPRLRNEAYSADHLDHQLSDQAVVFLANEGKNRISQDTVALSKIFKWFGGDFTEGQSLISFLSQYTTVDIAEHADVTYIDYDWTLNE